MTTDRHSIIAVVAGASGLVGEQLLNQLLADPAYGKVIVVVRKSLDLTHEKLEQKVTDFALLPSALEGMKADHGFCCLGTTIKKAGSKEKQYIIDHDFVVAFTRGCYSAGVTRFAVVSSIGASADSSNFYLRTKGAMELDVRKIPFKAIYFLQPSFLLGERKEFRAGEKIGISIMKAFNPLMIGSFKKYRGVQAAMVARCMIRALRSEQNGITIVRSDEIG